MWKACRVGHGFLFHAQYFFGASMNESVRKAYEVSWQELMQETVPESLRKFLHTLPKALILFCSSTLFYLPYLKTYGFVIIETAVEFMFTGLGVFDTSSWSQMHDLFVDECSCTWQYVINK